MKVNRFINRIQSIIVRLIDNLASIMTLMKKLIISLIVLIKNIFLYLLRIIILLIKLTKRAFIFLKKQIILHYFLITALISIGLGVIHYILNLTISFWVINSIAFGVVLGIIAYKYWSKNRIGIRVLYLALWLVFCSVNILFVDNIIYYVQFKNELNVYDLDAEVASQLMNLFDFPNNVFEFIDFRARNESSEEYDFSSISNSAKTMLRGPNKIADPFMNYFYWSMEIALIWSFAFGISWIPIKVYKKTGFNVSTILEVKSIIENTLESDIDAEIQKLNVPPEKIDSAKEAVIKYEIMKLTVPDGIFKSIFWK